MLVVVTGLPGSGKSTLSGQLAAEMRLPLIGKDHFKEILFDTLGVGDVAWSRRLGMAAIALQYDAMRHVESAVVDSALWPGVSEPQLEAVNRPMVQVYCDCPFEMARERFFSRVATGSRHPGHADGEQEDFERFRWLASPLAMSCPLVRVDTTVPIDALDVATRVLGAGNGR
jgi:predicted kinase